MGRLLCATQTPAARSLGGLASTAWQPQVQNHLAQANYYRDAANLGEYRSSAHFLPYINNEAPCTRQT